MNRWLFALALQALIAMWSTAAGAQQTVVASTLFQQAVSKMAVGQFSEACPLLEESYRLEAKSGTLFTLANCRDREGRVATASVRYSEYLRAYANMSELEKKKHAGRANVAETRVRELEPELPTLKVVRQGELPEGVTIRVDNVRLTPRTLNLPLPFDPGTHEITVEQKGTESIKRTVTLEMGHAATFDIDADVSLVKPLVEDTSTQAPSPILPPQPKKPAANPRRLAGFITLGVGGAGLVFGGVMGALALVEKRTVDEHCDTTTGTCNAQAGIDAENRRRLYAPLSTGGLIAGGILAAAGVVLVVTAPSPAKEKPMALTVRAGGVPGGGFVGIGGQF